MRRALLAAAFFRFVAAPVGDFFRFGVAPVGDFFRFGVAFLRVPAFPAVLRPAAPVLRANSKPWRPFSLMKSVAEKG